MMNVYLAEDISDHILCVLNVNYYHMTPVNETCLEGPHIPDLKSCISNLIGPVAKDHLS